VQKYGRSKSTAAILFFFEGNKNVYSIKNEFDKVVIAGGSNNTGVWR